MAKLSHALEDVIRRDRARVVAQLIRYLGSIDDAEEAYQEAVAAALATWPARGVPSTPSAWLMTAAKNWARDAYRHHRIVNEKAPLLAEDEANTNETFEMVADDQLRLVFTCCHPALMPEGQVALTLKLIAGFSTEEIARAFMCPEATIAQRIVRAKRTIEERALPYEVPGRAELPARLASVLAVVYIVFNEGHTSHTGPHMQLDRQREALRLSNLLCDLLPNESQVFAVFALVAFSCARAGTRVDEKGLPLLLPQQERTRWDRFLIKDGLVALERARRIGPRLSYVVQAEIAACHIIAPTWEQTNWAAILGFYDELFALTPSPVVALNRAIALCMHSGPEVALAALKGLEEPLSRYHHFYATRGDFRSRLGLDGADDYRRAIELTQNEGERVLLTQKLQESA